MGGRVGVVVFDRGSIDRTACAFEKRDARSASYWLVIVTFVPLLGSLFYLLFGINLIRRQGRKMRQALPGVATTEPGLFCPLPSDLDPSMREGDCQLAETLDQSRAFTSRWEMPCVCCTTGTRRCRR